MGIETSKIVSDLHYRIQQEAEQIIEKQLSCLGVKEREPDKLKRILYPDDPDAFCSYEYDGTVILGVKRKVGENIVSIEFDVPNLETQKQKGEVQDEKL